MLSAEELLPFPMTLCALSEAWLTKDRSARFWLFDRPYSEQKCYSCKLLQVIRESDKTYYGVMLFADLL